MSTAKEQTFDEIFDSLLPELRSDLERLDFRLRTITIEAKIAGITSETITKRLQERFWYLAAEVSGISMTKERGKEQCRTTYSTGRGRQSRKGSIHGMK